MTLINSTLESLEKEAMEKKEKKEDDNEEEEEVEDRVELMRVEAPNPLLPALSSALEVAYRPCSLFANKYLYFLGGLQTRGGSPPGGQQRHWGRGGSGS